MNARRVLIVAGLLAAIPAGLRAQQPVVQAVERVVSQAVKGVARLEFTISNEFMGQRTRRGQCICIDDARGVFMTRDIPSSVPVAEIKNLRLIMPPRGPGQSQRSFQAKWMGVDMELGLAFVQVQGKHPWKALRFSRTSDLKLGQRVLSVGLLGPQTGNAPYLGVGLVGAKLRLPGHVVYVAGELTNMSSPVFTTDGRLVGIVGQQIPMEVRMLFRGRLSEVGLAGQQQTSFFLPVEEFAHVLKRIPTPENPRRLGWIGVLSFDEVSEATASVKGLGDKPAALIGRVVDEGPAAKAGIRQGDVVLAVNGRPLEKLPTARLVAANLRRTLARMPVGQTVTLTLLREGKQFDKQVRLVPLPPGPQEAQRYYDRRLGFAGRDLVLLDRYAGQPQKLTDNGVLVLLVLENSPAAKATPGAIRRGDLILSVNEKATPTVKSLRAALEALRGTNKPIRVVVRRGDRREMLVMTPPAG